MNTSKKLLARRRLAPLLQTSSLGVHVRGLDGKEDITGVQGVEGPSRVKNVMYNNTKLNKLTRAKSATP